MAEFAQGELITKPPANSSYPIPAFHPPMTRETLSGGVSNGWTVEEQIYKSKMWLQQRNQSMLPKP